MDASQNQNVGNENWEVNLCFKKQMCSDIVGG